MDSKLIGGKYHESLWDKFSLSNNYNIIKINIYKKFVD